MTKVDMIIDLQFGSTGKGLIAGYLAKRNKYCAVITANMPNAGHTYIDGDGRKWIHKVLPNGIVCPDAQFIMIGPGAVFDMDRLAKEVWDSVDLFHNKTLVIHSCATVLKPEHAAREQAGQRAIASTMQGSMAAMVEKMERRPGSKILARDHFKEIRERLSGLNVIMVGDATWHNMIADCENVLAEGAQGYSLGINAGFWPYCTSRDCTPARFMTDMGIPHKAQLNVIGTARTYPIRVGNVEGGQSGGCYSDQMEVSWEDVGQTPETTTVTGRIRRVFTFSEYQIRDAIAVCRPDSVFLNFCNYVDSAMDLSDIKESIRIAGSVVGYEGWGATDSDVREV